MKSDKIIKNIGGKKFKNIIEFVEISFNNIRPVGDRISDKNQNSFNYKEYSEQLSKNLTNRMSHYIGNKSYLECQINPSLIKKIRESMQEFEDEWQSNPGFYQDIIKRYSKSYFPCYTKDPSQLRGRSCSGIIIDDGDVY